MAWYKTQRMIGQMVKVTSIGLLVLTMMGGTAKLAADEFTDTEKQARGQTVYFNAWGGDSKINAYIGWAGQRLKADYDITLKHVKLTDTASAVSRILAEKAAGRNDSGSIDLIWVNGENFAAMKRAGLLPASGWVTDLPNWRFTDAAALPAILSDFAEPTDGKEGPGVRQNPIKWRVGRPRR